MRQKLYVYILWIFEVVRITKIKIIGLILWSIFSTYLFITPHTYLVTKPENVRQVQPVSMKDAFIHFMENSENKSGIKAFLLALPFLLLFYPIVLIIQSNSENKWIRLFYILQGLLLIYPAWYVMHYNVSWKILPLANSEFDLLVGFKLRIIQIVSVCISIWSFIKGILPRLNFEPE